MAATEMRERPQIIYALVIRSQRVVLVEHTWMQGNFQQVMMQQILPKLSRSVDFKSYTYGDYAFHYITDDERELWYVCMAEKRMGRRIPFAFLAAVQESFQYYSSDQVQSAIAYGMDKEFRPTLQRLVEKYNAPEADRTAMMLEKVQHINDNLMEGLEKILERREKIDLLVTRSQTLSSSAGSFVREAGRLRRNVWWKNVRMIAALVCLVIFVIFMIAVASCGITFKHC